MGFNISDFWVFPERSSSQLPSFLCLPQDGARPVLEDLLGLTLLIRQAYGKCCSTLQTAEAVRPIRYENSSYLIISACGLLHKTEPRDNPDQHSSLKLEDGEMEQVENSGKGTSGRNRN